MPKYQLPIAIVLAICAVLSASFLWVRRPKEGKVKLPVYVDGEVDETYERDPFEVTTPADIKDGEPIDEASFWARVRRPFRHGHCLFSLIPCGVCLAQTRFRKMLLSLALITTLALETIALGWSIALDARQDIAILALQVLVAVYITTVSVRTLYHDSLHLHSEYMIHLSGLTSMAFVPLAISALVPNEPISISAELEDMMVKGLYYAVIAFYGVSCALAITTPLGPALHYPKELIYSEKTVASITNQAHDNVCGVTGRPISLPEALSRVLKVVYRRVSVGLPPILLHYQGSNARQHGRLARHR